MDYTIVHMFVVGKIFFVSYLFTYFLKKCLMLTKAASIWSKMQFSGKIF